MEQPKKELIKGITDLFEDYEETYVPGEWESFIKTKEKKRVLFPLWMRIAAVLFLVASILFFNRKDFIPQGRTEHLVFQKSKPGQTPDPDKTTGAGLASPSAGLKDTTIQSDARTSHASSATQLANNNIAAAVSDKISGIKVNHRSATDKKQSSSNGNLHLNTSTAKLSAEQLKEKPLKNPETPNTFLEEKKNPQTAQNRIAATAVPAIGKQDTAASTKNKKMSTIDFLTAESKAGSVAVKRKEAGSKWDFGLAVIPSATSASTNVGAAVTTAYRISSKFSISSGIAMVQLEGGKSISPPAMGNMQSFARTLSSKQLVGVDANIKAIDIPLGLVYNVNKHYYTSAGISYFNVLSDKRNNTVVQVAQVNQMTVNQFTGVPASYKALVSQEVSEPVTDSPLQGNSYLGFFNFSIGRKQHIFNHYDILIEPFVKLPIGKLSDEDLKLMNSGIKFQLAF
ncbi:hypothetical protein [Pedobacter sp. L105]|uniref:hypothetical protein n=1 Tax=Pedobacter sp. L105 TaxID=1641871 RepID=UPI00131E87E5|nr:hypothetical protein [Pedobacter sp. L105]